MFPRFLACEELRAGEFLLVGLTNIVAASTKFEHILNLLGVESFGIVDVTIRTRDGDDLRTEFGCFFGSTPGHIAEAGEGDGLSLDVKSMGLHHVVYEVEGAEACSFRTEDRTAPFHALTCESCAVELACQFLIIAKEVSDFTGAYADITSRHIHVWADDLIEFAHKGLTELHHLVVALAANREV